MRRAYTPSEIEACMPAPTPVRQQASARTFTNFEVKGLEEIQRALACIPPRIPGHGTYPMYRNILWGLIKACVEAGASADTAISMMAAHSPQWPGIDQVAHSGGSEITAGSFWYWASQHGYELLRRKRSCRRRSAIRRPSAYVVAERRRNSCG